MPRLNEPDTEELLARAKTGDERAGIEAIARQRERLRKMLVTRMDKRLKARLDPSDVIQESIIGPSQRLGAFFRQDKVSFYVWLRSLTFERLIDMQRAHLYAKRRSVSREERSVLSLPDESVAELAGRLVNVAADPRAGMVRDELRARVRIAIDQLSPDDREVLVLRHLEDLSVGETADALGIKESAVKMRALRALKKLRERNRPRQPFLTAGVTCMGPGQVRPFAKELRNGTFGRFGTAAALAAAAAAIWAGPPQRRGFLSGGRRFLRFVLPVAAGTRSRHSPPRRPPARHAGAHRTVGEPPASFRPDSRRRGGYDRDSPDQWRSLGGPGGRSGRAGSRGGRRRSFAASQRGGRVMLNLPAQPRVYLCTTPVDLRKSFDGLSGLVESVFQGNVLDGHLFLFVNKRQDRIKALWWDRDGLIIWYKRLEAGCFEIPRGSEGAAHVTLDATELAMLLGGVSLASVKRRKRFSLAG